MAYIGDSCLKIGDIRWDIGSEISVIPTFVFQSDLVQGILNGFVNLTATVYASEYDTLLYKWSIELKPHDSMVDETGIIYRNGGNTVLLHLDKIGLYKIKLVVSASSGGCSDPGFIHVMCTPFDYNYINQTALDVSWIWKTLPDFWQLASNRDKARIEVFWRGINQMLGSDLLNAYNVKESASIATIRDSVIRRWLKIDTSIHIDTCLIKVQIDKSLSVDSTAVEGGFITQVEKVNIPFSYTYKIACKVVSSDKVLLFDKFLSDSDVAKTVRVFRVLQNASVFLFQTNIIKVENKDNGCIITLSALFNKEIILSEEDLYLIIGVDISNFPCSINGKYTAVLSNDGQSLTKKRVPKLDGVAKLSISFSSFLIIPNAEARGVTSGDILNITIRDINTGIQYSTNLDIIGCVDKFVLFTIPSLLEFLKKAYVVLEPLLDTDYIATQVYEYLCSPSFTQTIQTSFFEDVLDCYLQLTSETSKSYRISFNKIYLRKRVVVDADIISLTRLTERIERVEYENTSLIANDDDIAIAERPPIDLFENLDFFVDSNKIVGRMLRSIDFDKFTTSAFDFNFSGVENGDTIFITNGFGKGRYDIVKISADGSTIYVNPPARLPFIAADFTIQKNRNNGNRHLVFYKQLPNVDPLDSIWCEASVINNDRDIDLNFGALANFRLDKWYDLNIETSYKNTILAILLARMTSPSIKNIQSLTSNIAGLPFLDTKARIVDINEKFEVSPIDNITPSVSSLIVEEIDEFDIPTGIYRNIKFKANTILTDSEFTGLAINPLTVNRYKVGDIVEQFSTLALGVIVDDLYNEDGRRFLRNIKDRHRFKVTISADSVSTSESLITLIRSFILDLKPAYTQFMLSIVKFFTDKITIEEDVSFKIKTRFFDNPYITQQVAQIQDEWTPYKQLTDRFAFIPLNVDFPKNGSIRIGDISSFLVLSIEKEAYIRNLYLRTAINDIRDSVILFSNNTRTTVGINDISFRYDLGEIHVHLDTQPEAVYMHTYNPNSVKYTFIRFISDKIDSQDVEIADISNFIPIDNINVAVGDYVYIGKQNVPRLVVQELLGNSARVYPPMPNTVLNNRSKVIVRREGIFRSTIFTGFANFRSANSLQVLNTPNLVYEGVEPGDMVTLSIGETITYLKVTAVTRSNILYITGDTLDMSMGNEMPIQITRDRGSDFGDKHDETVTASITQCFIKMSRPGSTRLGGRIIGNTLFMSVEDAANFALKLGDIVQIKEVTSYFTEGKGVARVVGIDLQVLVNEVSVELSENVAGLAENPINISFNIVKQANSKLTRLE